MTPTMLRRYSLRDLGVLAVALAGPLAASDVLLPLRASWSSTNAALLLVAVVAVAALATGWRARWPSWERRFGSRRAGGRG